MASVVTTDLEIVIFSIFRKYTDSEWMDRKQLGNLIDDLGISDHDELFMVIDRDENGMISFEEFKRWWLKKDKIRENKLSLLTDAHDFFNRYAVDGKIDYDQFKKLIRDLHKTDPALSDFRKLDKNGNGSISFHEFLDWLKWY